MRLALLLSVAALLTLATEGKKSSSSRSRSYSSKSYSKSYSYKPSYSSYYNPSTVIVTPGIGGYGGYYNNYGYGYNNYNSYSVSYTGMALGQMSDGTYGMIPTSQCPFDCSVNGVCGTESECDIAGVVMIVVGVIFGLIFLSVCIVICCCICRA